MAGRFLSQTTPVAPEQQKSSPDSRARRWVATVMLLCLCTSPSLLQAQFSPLTGVNGVISGQSVYEGDASIADFNGDGNNDLIVTGKRSGGTPSTRVYVNNGLALAWVLSGITDLQNSRLDVGDYDNNGTIDVVITGESGGTGVTKVFSNSGLPNFTDETSLNVNIPQVSAGDVAWGDYDNDGDLDLLVTGIPVTSPGSVVIRVIENRVPQGGGFQVDLIASGTLVGLKNASVSWVDYDMDGKLDIVTTGQNSSNQSRSSLYKNLGNSQFVLVPTANFQNMAFGEVVHADINNDGLPDILMTGQNNTANRYSHVYVNQSDVNPGNPFVLSQSLTGLTKSKIVPFDYNNDGWIDIIAAGQNGATDAARTTLLLENDQTGSFSVVSAGLTDVNGNPALAVGDISVPADGKVDLFISGLTASPNSTGFSLLENIDPNANDTYGPPTGVTANVVGSTVQFSWNPPTTYSGVGSLPASEEGLSYEISIGTAPDDDSVDPAHADVPTGKRFIQKVGKIKGTTWTISGLPTSPNYWVRVQAIDAALEGSDFSSPVNFSVVNVVPIISVFEDSTGYAFGAPPPTGPENGYVSWCDCNADGNMDVLYGGNQSTFPSLTNFTNLYTNDGDGTFQLQPVQSAAIPDIYHGDVAWGDANNDGLPDLAICGVEDDTQFGTSIAKVLINTGNCQMGTVIDLGTGVSQGDLDWGDVDGDGDRDLILTGKALTGNILRVYLNNYAQTGTVSFSNSANAFTGVGVETGSVRLADYDNDGDLDFVVSGKGTSANLTKVFENDGTGIFTDLGTSLFTGVRQSSNVWLDMDNDGNLELLVAGNVATSGLQTSARVYKYFPSFGLFLNVNVPGLTDNSLSIAGGSIDAGDYDNDGLVDLLVSGRSGNNVSSSPFTAVYKNQGNLTFTQDLLGSGDLVNVFESSEARFGDYNGDHKLDVLMVGTGGANNKLFKLYKNVEPTANVSPGIPQNASDTLLDFEVMLSWDPPQAPSNNPSRVNGFHYELYLDGPAAGTQDKVSAHADINSGYRRLVKLGNAMQNQSYLVKDLVQGTYNWKVQAIDQDWEGSGFLDGGTFTYQDPTFVQVNSTLFPNNDQTPMTSAAMAWGDYQGDNYLDVIILGTSDLSTWSTKLYQYDPLNNIFLEDPLYSSVFEDLSEGAADWGDFDNDGDLDLALTGASASGPFSRIYINISGGFTAVDTLQLPGLEGGMIKWTDLNSDGFLDLILTGHEASGVAHTYVYRNTSQGNLVLENTSVFDAANGDVATADIDQDGDQDIIISGSVNSEGNNGSTRIYLNQGDFTFANAGVAGLPNYRNSTLSVGDVDANGFPDLVIAGISSTNNYHGRFLINADGSNWTSVQSFNSIGVDDLSLGDYNDDGFPDLVVVGDDGTGNPQSNLHRFNTGLGLFVDEPIDGINIPPLTEGAAVGWADFDQDGKLDLLTLGEGVGGRQFDLLQNLDPTPNFVPGKPRNPAVQINGDEVIFSWEEPSNVTPQPFKQGMSYQVYVGTTNGGFDRMSPMADIPAGTRQIVARGQVYDTTSFRLQNLPAGSYFWGVQAIDADYEGSQFETGPTFIFEAPTFTDVTSSAFALVPNGFSAGDLAWADVDADDDLDLIVAGQTNAGRSTTLFVNTNGTFTASTTSFTAVSEALTIWTDVNNDNQPDLLLAGNTSSSTRFTDIYLNQGGGNFAQANAGLPALSDASASFADLNRDGNLDLFLSGNDGNASLADVFWNDGNGNFTAANAGIVNLSGGSAWATDVDLDGIADLILSGETTSGIWQLRMYRGDGNGNFVEFASGITAVSQSTLSLADYDGDGDPDLAMVGGSSAGAGRVFLNNGSGSFSLGPGIDGVLNGDLQWGDMDENGRPDLLIAGDNGSSNIVSYYRNSGTGLTKSTVAALPIQTTSDTDLAFGDFTGDGKPDLAVMGLRSAAPTTRSLRLYENIDPATNQVPGKPTGLAASVSGDTIIFSWSKPAGSSFVTNGYSYQLAIGTAAQGSDVLSPLSATSDGYRLIVGPGKQGQSKEAKVIGLPSDTYHWGVQAVGQDFEASDFSFGTAIPYQAPALVDWDINAWAQAPSSGIQLGDLSWADIDNDGKLDLLVVGEEENGFSTMDIYTRKSGALELDATASQNLIGMEFTAVAWADVDLDGDPDLIASGQVGNSGNNYQTRLYRNNNGVFVNVPSVADSLPQVRKGAIAVGDVDQDGDPDLAITGETASGPVGGIYLNDNGSFTLDRRRPIQAVAEGDLEWGDFDRDGDLDLALTGANGVNLYGLIYRNRVERGDFEVLSSSEANLVKTKESSLAWGDYDNDGDMDLLVSGETSTTQVQPRTRLYAYNANNGTFNQVSGISITGFRNGDAVWTDVNEDGWLDLIIGGKFGALGNDRRTALYLGAPNGSLTLDVATTNHLKDVDQGAAFAVGDFDGDGKADLALAGRIADSSPRRTLTIYRNVDPQPNVAPGVPRTPDAQVDGDSVRLSWLIPLGLDANTAEGISYNVSLRQLNSGNRVSGLADLASGFRKIVKSGNAGLKNFMTVRGLTSGEYVWQVQAIDHDLEGGPFSVIDTFTFNSPAFININRRVLNELIPGITEGDAEWGDYDGDGDMDLLISGRTAGAAFFTRLYESTDGHTLTPLDPGTLGLPQLRQSAIAWQDIDGDGDLDVAMAGFGNGGAQTMVYEQEAGQFQAVNASFEAVTDGDLAWIDVDRDGDSDLLLTGTIGGNGLLSLYINEDSTFTKALNNWPGLESSTLAVADANVDGLMDFVVTGDDGNGPRILLFIGDPVSGYSFTDITGATPVEAASLAWMDVNHDGYPDLFVIGSDQNGDPVSELLTNDGTGMMTASTPLDPLHLGQVLVADLNENSYGDILTIGENTGASRQTQLFTNQSGSGFQSAPLAAGDITPMAGEVILAPGDINGDGLLDFMLSGNADGGTQTILYLNRFSDLNLVADPPENLDRKIVGSNVILSWDPPSGMTLEEQAGLSYQVRLTESGSGAEAVPGMALPDGTRTIVAHGQAGQRLELAVSDLTEGEVYSWSVQAIGQDFEGSVFPVNDSFSFDPPAFDDRTNVVFSGDPPEPVAEARIALGDYDADGDLDLIAVGETEAGFGSVAVFRNETTPANNGKFVLDTAVTQSLTAVKAPALAWKDVNGDGFLDLFLAGKQNDGTSLSSLYFFENGNYVRATSGVDEIPHVSGAMADWADYDLDGDLDLVLAGMQDDGTRVTRIFRQMPGAVWEPDTAAFAEIDNVAVAEGDLAWGDFDADGDMDLAMAGTSNIGPVMRVLKNDGTGVFSIGLYSELVPAKNGRLAWGDFNNDGDLDLLVTGDNSTQSNFVPVTVVYEYLAADDRFTEYTNQDFEDLTQGSASWGDFNNDGWLDILISGKYADEDSARSTRLYRNQGGVSFIEDLNTSGDLINVDLGAAAWGDYNGNQKLDVFLTGRTAASPPTYTFVLFENIDTLLNVSPVQPLDPGTQVLGREVTLSWDSPNHLPAAQIPGLTYNVVLKKVGDNISLMPPQADKASGYRRIVRQGNIGHRLSWTLRDLEDGDYVWQVQTVDQDFEGSVFSDPIPFSFTNPIPKIVSQDYPELWEEEAGDVSAQIVVNDPAIIDEVLVFYKGIASADWNQAVATGSGTDYEFVISDASVDEMGVEYVFQVIGTYGYDTFSDTGYTYRRYPNGFDLTGLRFGKRFDDYDIVSIPLMLDNPGVAQVIEEYGEYNDRKWRLWHYSNSVLNEYTLGGFDTFEPGKGYWLINKDPNLFNTGAGRVVEANDANPYELSLNLGFNQLGSPFPYAVGWQDILDANPPSVVEQLEDLLAYEEGYVVSDRMNLFRGGFVFAHEPLTLRIPVRKNNNIQRLADPYIPSVFLDRPAEAGFWYLPLEARVGDKTYRMSGFGMAEGASSERDPLDRMLPPRFGDFVDVTIGHSDYFYQYFTRDVIAPNRHAVWEFTVSTNLGDPILELSWDTEFLPQTAANWVLMDIDQQRFIRIHDMSSYRTPLDDGEHHFRLIYGDDSFIRDRVVPDRIHVGMAFPNPASESVTIPFSLPPNEDVYDVRIVVINHLGQEIDRIEPGSLHAGFHYVSWDGTNAEGLPVASGLYLYRLEVDGVVWSGEIGKLQWR